VNLLKIDNLVSKYGNVMALHGISLEVNEGECVSLIGSNGAGKTTTLMTISGWVKAAAGKIVFDGKEIQNKPMHIITQSGITHCPEGRKLFGDMSVHENLLMGYYVDRVDKKPEERMEYVFELFPILKERLAQEARTLSGGQQQMCAIGRALMLDEPSLGLAPQLVESVFEVLQKIHRSGTSILLVEQNARMALAISDRCYVLEVGNITIEGTGKELMNDERISKAYLGG
jgi:branched-chain amino acid transport system ATP-binding protein